MSFDKMSVLLSRRLRDLTRCTTCGRSTIVLQVRRRRRYVAQAVSPETHCACPGGPAAPVQGKTDADFLRADR